MQFEHRLTSQLSSAALIRFARVGETVTEYNLSSIQAGQNHFLNMLRARGEHQCELGHGCKGGSPRVQKQAPDFLAGLGPAGFSRHHNRKSVLGQLLRKARELGALAAPIQSFKGDKFAALRTHASMIPTKVVVGPRPSQALIKSFPAKPRSGEDSSAVL